MANHPRIVAALQHELARSGPAMLQSHVADSAGELAAPLVVTRPHVDQFVEGVTAAAKGLGSSGSLWTEALALARGVMNI